MSKQTLSREALALASLLEQASRSLHGLGFAEDLFPAQWSALRYFARADEELRTASALARFQGLAVGPVTRTVRTLVSKGFLAGIPRPGRGAPKQIEVTQLGLELLTRDPLNRVAEACAELAPDERRSFARALGFVLGRLQVDGVW